MQLTNITCDQCSCMLTQSNVWTAMACQATRATCQIVSLDLQSLTQYLRIDASSLVCFSYQEKTASEAQPISEMSLRRRKRQIEGDSPKQGRLTVLAIFLRSLANRHSLILVSLMLWNFDDDLQDFYGTHHAIATTHPPIFQSPGYNGHGSCLLLRSAAPSVSLESSFFSGLVRRSFTIEFWILVQFIPDPDSDQVISILAMLERETSRPLLTLTVQRRRVQFTLASTHASSHQVNILPIRRNAR